MNREQNVIDRLNQILDEQGVKKAELARVAEVTPQAINNWFKNGKVSQESASLLSKKYGYSIDWILGGDSLPKIIDDVDVIDTDKDYSDTHIYLDLYDIKLSAGNGQQVIEWIPRKSDEPLLFREAWFRVKRLSPKNCKAMYVRGHSMTPVLQDWDTVIVDISDTEIADGEIYALIYNKHFYIKQIVRTGKGIQLLSFNPDYDPIDIPDDDLANLQIIGRKVWRGG